LRSGLSVGANHFFRSVDMLGTPVPSRMSHPAWYAAMLSVRDRVTGKAAL